jgi:hypothetical protein
VVLNQTTETAGVAEETNPDALKKLSCVPVLGVVPWKVSREAPIWTEILGNAGL